MQFDDVLGESAGMAQYLEDVGQAQVGLSHQVAGMDDPPFGVHTVLAGQPEDSAAVAQDAMGEADRSGQVGRVDGLDHRDRLRG